MSHYQAICLNKKCNGRLIDNTVCEHSVPHGIGEDCFGACAKMGTSGNCALIEVVSPGKPYKVKKILGEKS